MDKFFANQDSPKSVADGPNLSAMLERLDQTNIYVHERAETAERLADRLVGTRSEVSKHDGAYAAEASNGILEELAARLNTLDRSLDRWASATNRIMDRV